MDQRHSQIPERVHRSLDLDGLMEYQNSFFLHDRSVVKEPVPELAFPTKYDYIISDRDQEACQSVLHSLQASRTLQLRVLYVIHRSPHRQAILSELRGYKIEQLIGYFTSQEFTQLLAEA